MPLFLSLYIIISLHLSLLHYPLLTLAILYSPLSLSSDSWYSPSISLPLSISLSPFYPLLLSFHPLDFRKFVIAECLSVLYGLRWWNLCLMGTDRETDRYRCRDSTDTDRQVQKLILQKKGLGQVHLLLVPDIPLQCTWWTGLQNGETESDGNMNSEVGWLWQSASGLVAHVVIY